MAGFLQKVRALTLGTAHDLLDKAIDMNSPSMLRQYVRDLEDALDKMKNEAAIQAGSVRTMDRELGDAQATLTTKTTQIKGALAVNKQDAARVLGSSVVILQNRIVQMTADLAAQRKSSADTDTAVGALEQKHSEMLDRLRQLERLDQDTKIKERSSSAMEAAGKLISGGSDMSVDNIEDSMRRRNDVAQAKFDRSIGSVHVEEDPEHTQQVDDLLASLATPVKKTA